MAKIYLDSETCGLHSQMVLLQYAEEDGPITLYDVWTNPVRETLRRIEWLCGNTVVGFNLAFDWFHIVKTYTVFRLANPDWIPIEHVNEIAMLEPKGQDGPCVKPANALDLLLHSRKGPYQSLMAREDVRIRKVPTPLAYALAQELEQRVALDGIYFARSADKDAPRWQVFDRKDSMGVVDNEFKDVVLRFSPAGGLKFLAEHAMGYKPKYHYKDVEPDRSWLPYELGFAPTALAVSSPEQNWEVWKEEKNEKRKLAGHAWPAVIHKFVEHWATRDDARDYATDDIVYTRGLDEHFGFPTPGDDDSILACMVPVVRWRGFKIDVEGMKCLLAKAQATVAASPVNINKPKEVRAYLMECMDEIEAKCIEDSTKKANLERVEKFKVFDAAPMDVDNDGDDNDFPTADWSITESEHCLKCDGGGKAHTGNGCKRCNGHGYLQPGPHPAAVRARELLDVKIAAKEIELYTKLILAGKFHASFVIVGTLSSRMAGGDGLNAQGIKKTKEVRRMFPLAWDGYHLCGGDFDSFEVTLADAVYGDPALRKALTTKVSCHKCDGLGRANVCQACKGKGKVKDEPCASCEGRGRFPITVEEAPNYPRCGDCEGCGRTTKKIHALFAMSLFPGTTYEDVMASEGTANDMYTKGKSGVFGMIYGGDWNTLVKNLGIPPDVAKAAFERFGKTYPGIEKARSKTFNQFCSMRQPDGTHVIWAEPAEFIESFLGFRRYFTLENTITRALYDLSRRPPKSWRDCKIKVIRNATKGVQFAYGAVSSALYGAAFQMQAANMRAAANHEIQSPGGQITKAVQRAIWDLQPAGVHPLYVAPMNVHDELMTVTHPDYVKPVTAKVQDVVERYRPKVPLIGMTWFEDMANWAEKKAGAEKVKIRCQELMEVK